MRVCDTLAIVGLGLIGSSLARAAIKSGAVARVIAIDTDKETAAKAVPLGVAHEAGTSLALAASANIIVLATPVGAMPRAAAALIPHLKPGAILTDVGSVKTALVEAITPLLPAGIAYVPAHPIAGTEFSGIEAGFAELFNGRWCILTPTETTPSTATDTIRALWEATGSRVAVMTAEHHDNVLAITSHLPHLIAYTIVGTAFGLEQSEQAEVMQYSAGGFRDFTRIAASDPVMWRDIFLNNKDAVLEMLGRFTEDLSTLQRAIRFGDGAALEEHFRRTRAIRKGVVEAKQAL